MMKKYFLAVFLMAITGGMMTSCGDDDTNEFDDYKTVVDNDDEDGKTTHEVAFCATEQQFCLISFWHEYDFKNDDLAVK
jgi:hypothetical protein